MQGFFRKLKNISQIFPGAGGRSGGAGEKGVELAGDHAVIEPAALLGPGAEKALKTGV